MFLPNYSAMPENPYQSPEAEGKAKTTRRRLGVPRIVLVVFAVMVIASFLANLWVGLRLWLR